jgi:transposase
MGNPRGVRRNAEQLKELEQRRLLGARLLRQGVPQAEVARRVGVHRQSVSRWAEQLQHGGRQALQSAGRTGRKPRLGPAELKRIVRGLERGPEALGYETGLWTAWRVADLIERKCGVKFSAVQAWRILRQLGWTPQRPAGRALEREEEKIRCWKQQRWPQIKKKPKKKGAEEFAATMYLMWDPTLPSGCTAAYTVEVGSTFTEHASTCNSIPVPVQIVQWGFGDDAVKTLDPSEGQGVHSWSFLCGYGLVSACGPSRQPIVTPPPGNPYPVWTTAINAGDTTMQ